MYLDCKSGRLHPEGAFNIGYKQSESVEESAQAQIGFDELDIGAHRQA